MIPGQHDNCGIVDVYVLQKFQSLVKNSPVCYMFFIDPNSWRNDHKGQAYTHCNSINWKLL